MLDVKSMGTPNLSLSSIHTPLCEVDGRRRSRSFTKRTVVGIPNFSMSLSVSDWGRCRISLNDGTSQVGMSYVLARTILSTGSTLGNFSMADMAYPRTSSMSHFFTSLSTESHCEREKTSGSALNLFLMHCHQHNMTT